MGYVQTICHASHCRPFPHGPAPDQALRQIRIAAREGFGSAGIGAPEQQQRLGVGGTALIGRAAQQ